MQIGDFKYSKTPIIHCTVEGRVLNKNPSAQKNLREGVERKKVVINGRYATYGAYRGFCCEEEDGIWAIFPGYAQFDFEGRVFCFAEDAISISCKRMLELESAFSSLAESGGDTAKLWRTRKIIYDQYSIVFEKYDMPLHLYAIGHFIENFSRACGQFYPHFGAEVRVYAPHENRSVLINVRNVTIILTQICTTLLSKIRYQRLNIVFNYSTEYLCAQIKGVTEVIPFVCENERDIMRLAEFMREYTIGLVSLDVAMETCGYFAEYDINDDGIFSVRIYFKTETDIRYLRDKDSEYDLTNDIGKVIEMQYYKCRL